MTKSEYWKGFDEGYDEGHEAGLHEAVVRPGPAWKIARDYLRQIRMGYTLNVTLQEILEEMEEAEEFQ